MTGLTCLADATCETPHESFTVSRQGVITNFNPFGAPSSFASAVSPSSTGVGIYTDSSGVTHGYKLYRELHLQCFPGSIFTFNGELMPGDIVGTYIDTSNVSIVSAESGIYTGFDRPGPPLAAQVGSIRAVSSSERMWTPRMSFTDISGRRSRSGSD